MAKRLQQWRAVLARSQGCTVSINIAPATATASVVHNKQFAAAYGGMHVSIMSVYVCICLYVCVSICAQ